MLEHFRNPEYLHVLLNPLPVYGLALGLIALVIALFSRARAARVTALSIVFISSFSAIPVSYYGENARAGVIAMADDDGSKWLNEHQRRAEKLIFAFDALALLAAVALVAERFAPRAAFILCLTTAVLTTATLAAGGYIAAAGGRIRHKEFRYVPVPDSSTESH